MRDFSGNVQRRLQKLRLAQLEIDPRCRYCGRLLTAETSTLDHKTPPHRGGTNDAENLVLACKLCNAAKSGWTLDEWKQRLLRGLFRVA